MLELDSSIESIDMPFLGHQPAHLRGQVLQTPLGDVLAIATADALIYVDFLATPKAQQNLSFLTAAQEALFATPTPPVLQHFAKELAAYFQGAVTIFTTPVQFYGSPFQQEVWRCLQQLTYAETASYAQIAAAVGRPQAMRAIGNANGANNLAIIVPCHRVIQRSGALGGYAGGVERKEWLLAHEAAHAQTVRAA